MNVEYNKKSNDIPLFHRNDITIGQCLGKGSFSKVYAIKHLHHKNKENNHDILGSSTSSASILSTSPLSPQAKSSTMTSTSPLKNIFSMILLPSKQHKKGKDKYAFKRLRKTTLRKEENYVRNAAHDLLNEVKILSLLDHENIVQAHGISNNNSNDSNGSNMNGRFENLFLIIDQVDCTLDDLIRRWQIQTDLFGVEDYSYLSYDAVEHNGDSLPFVKEKFNIAVQIANALQYMHNLGYIYRDLKPQNIGLIEDYVCVDHSYNIRGCRHKNVITAKRVKLFDFGFARKLPSSSKFKYNDNDNNINNNNNTNDDELYRMSWVGSIKYVAPEVYNGWYNCKADVYSWSIVFSKMLGCKNHNDNNCIYDDPSSSSSSSSSSPVFVISKEIQNIIDRSRENDVSKRYTSQELYSELKRYYNHEFSKKKSQK